VRECALGDRLPDCSRHRNCRGRVALVTVSVCCREILCGIFHMVLNSGTRFAELALQDLLCRTCGTRFGDTCCSRSCAVLHGRGSRIRHSDHREEVARSSKADAVGRQKQTFRCKTQTGVLSGPETVVLSRACNHKSLQYQRLDATSDRVSGRDWSSAQPLASQETGLRLRRAARAPREVRHSTRGLHQG